MEVEAITTLRRINAGRTLHIVSQTILSVPGITGWEIMDVLAGGVGVSDTVFTVRPVVSWVSSSWRDSNHEVARGLSGVR